MNKLHDVFNLEKRHVFFVDDNFSANRDRTRDLLSGLGKLNFNLEWSTQEEVKIYRKKDILNLMQKTGCKRLYIGLESFNQAALEEYDKPQSIEDIKKPSK